MEVAKEWPITVTNGTIMVIERFYESQINNFTQHPNKVNSHLHRSLTHDYSLIRYTVEHAIDFTKGMQQIVDLLHEKK
jgi:DNA mismatch repair protein MutS